MALWLRARWLARLGLTAGRRLYLSAILGYVAAYYALWALADVLILFADLDAGWLLRLVPNQLYYGLYVRFAFLASFRRR